MAGLPPSRNRRSGTCDSLSNALGFSADRERHLRAIDYLQWNGAGVLHGVDPVGHLPSTFEKPGSERPLPQSMVSGAAGPARRRGYVGRGLECLAATGRSLLWSSDGGSRVAVLFLLATAPVGLKLCAGPRRDLVPIKMTRATLHCGGRSPVVGA